LQRRKALSQASAALVNKEASRHSVRRIAKAMQDLAIKYFP
jgi:hypothetical protein